MTELERMRAAYRLSDLSKCLENLMSWATHPEPLALEHEWAELHKNEIVRVSDIVISTTDDQGLKAKVKSSTRLSFRLVALLTDRPGLSTKPVEQWPLQDYRNLYDDLAKLARDFRLMAETLSEPIEKQSRPKAKTTKDDDSWLGWKKVADWAEDLGVSTTTVNRVIREELLPDHAKRRGKTSASEVDLTEEGAERLRQS